jgi:hypothetical protein
LDGGVAVLDELDTLDTAPLVTSQCSSGRVLNGGWLARWLAERDVTEAIVERAQSMPDQGITSAFNYGMAFGQIIGVLQTCLIPFELIHPLRWKGHYRLANRKGKPRIDKDATRRLAIATWPANATDFERKLDVHRADAALLARYAMRSSGASGSLHTGESLFG